MLKRIQQIVPGLLLGAMMLPVAAVTAGFSFADTETGAGTKSGQNPSLPSATIYQDIELDAGWNIVSSRVQPSSADLETVFASIADRIEVVVDEAENEYRPATGLNDIGSWEASKAYKIRASSSAVLRLEGTAVPSDVKLSLSAGWNFLPYLSNAPLAVDEVLLPLGGALRIAKDEAGRTYIPEHGINEIVTMMPGEGYEVYVDESTTLTYPFVTTPFTYAPGCLAAKGAVLIEHYGTLTPGVAADSLQRAGNAAAINAAIAAAPVGGSVCLPADSLYLTFDRAPRHWYGHIDIARDEVTLWGAGACGWGDLPGCTYLATPGMGYYGDVDSDGDNELIRGQGIQISAMPEAGADSVRSITLRGFEMDGRSGWTGCYDLDYEHDVPTARDCWDMQHKGINLGGGGDKTDILIEDVSVHSYKGEVMYLGGYGFGTVTARRVWSYDSNASANNFATAQTLTIEDSHFGPDVRFWGEYLAEHKKDLTATFTGNTYEGCSTTNGCLAVAFDEAENAAVGQSWTWTDNSFSCENGQQRAFLIESGIYELSVTNNAIHGCALFISNSGNGGHTTPVTITGNMLTQSGGSAFLFQSGLLSGRIVNNTFVQTGTGPMYGLSTTPDLKDLIIENNVFEGYSSPSVSGSGNVFPLIRDNAYVSFTHSIRNLFSDGLVSQPSYEYMVIQSAGEVDRIAELGAGSADDQNVLMIGYGSRRTIFPAAVPQHGWTNDLFLTENDSIHVVFDLQTRIWRLAEGVVDDSNESQTEDLETESGSLRAAAPSHYWSLDEPSDVRWDYVGDAHAMAYAEEPGPVQGFVNNAVRYQDADRKGRLDARHLRLGGRVSFTVAVWAKTPRTFADYTLLSSEKRWSITVGAVNRLAPAYYVGGTKSTGKYVEEGTDSDAQFKLYWFHYEASDPSLSVAINDGAWATISLSDTLESFDHIRFGADDLGYRFGAIVDEVVVWKGETLSRSERAHVYANHRGPAYFDLDEFAPPEGPFVSVIPVDTLFVTDRGLIEFGEAPGTYWLRPYPLHEWDPVLASAYGDYIWWRSTDHQQGTGGLYYGFSSNPSEAPKSWTLALDAFLLSNFSGSQFAQLETPELSYHPDDPEGKPFYLTAHGNHVTKTIDVTSTTASQYAIQESVLFRSADLRDWEYDDIALPAHGYVHTDPDQVVNHTGYMTQVEWEDGTYRAYSNASDAWSSSYTLSNVRHADGSFGPITHDKRTGQRGWWSSPDGRSWTLEWYGQRTDHLPYGNINTGGASYSGFFAVGGKSYVLSDHANGDMNIARIYEIDKEGAAVYPGWPVLTHYIYDDPDMTSSYGRVWLQATRILVEDDVAHIYVKKGYREPDGRIEYYRAELAGPLRAAN